METTSYRRDNTRRQFRCIGGSSQTTVGDIFAMRTASRFWSWCCEWRTCRTALLIFSTWFVTDQLSYAAAMQTTAARFESRSSMTTRQRAAFQSLVSHIQDGRR